MSFMPDPLHPAIVHFPVVLILLGCAAAWMAVFVRKGVPWFAVVLLILGAAGAWAAKETGKSDGGLLDNMSPQMESLLDAHQNWAGMTVMAATITALLAVTAVGLSSFPRLARTMAIVAAAAASIASWAVYETGHRGGALVFEHGAGMHVSSPAHPPANGDSSVPTEAQLQSNHGETD